MSTGSHPPGELLALPLLGATLSSFFMTSERDCSCGSPSCGICGIELRPAEDAADLPASASLEAGVGGAGGPADVPTLQESGQQWQPQQQPQQQGQSEVDPSCGWLETLLALLSFFWEGILLSYAAAAATFTKFIGPAAASRSSGVERGPSARRDYWARGRCEPLKKIARMALITKTLFLLIFVGLYLFSDYWWKSDHSRLHGLIDDVRGSLIMDTGGWSSKCVTDSGHTIGLINCKKLPRIGCRWSTLSGCVCSRPGYVFEKKICVSREQAEMSALMDECRYQNGASGLARTAEDCRMTGGCYWDPHLGNGACQSNSGALLASYSALHLRGSLNETASIDVTHPGEAFQAAQATLAELSYPAEVPGPHGDPPGYSASQSGNLRGVPPFIPLLRNTTTTTTQLFFAPEAGDCPLRGRHCDSPCAIFGGRCLCTNWESSWDGVQCSYLSTSEPVVTTTQHWLQVKAQDTLPPYSPRWSRVMAFRRSCEGDYQGDTAWSQWIISGSTSLQPYICTYSWVDRDAVKHGNGMGDYIAHGGSVDVVSFVDLCLADSPEIAFIRLLRSLTNDHAAAESLNSIIGATEFPMQADLDLMSSYWTSLMSDGGVSISQWVQLTQYMCEESWLCHRSSLYALKKAFLRNFEQCHTGSTSLLGTKVDPPVGPHGRCIRSAVVKFGSDAIRSGWPADPWRVLSAAVSGHGHEIIPGVRSIRNLCGAARADVPVKVPVEQNFQVACRGMISHPPWSEPLKEECQLGCECVIAYTRFTEVSLSGVAVPAGEYSYSHRGCIGRQQGFIHVAEDGGRELTHSSKICSANDDRYLSLAECAEQKQHDGDSALCVRPVGLVAFDVTWAFPFAVALSSSIIAGGLVMWSIRIPCGDPAIVVFSFLACVAGLLVAAWQLGFSTYFCMVFCAVAHVFGSTRAIAADKKTVAPHAAAYIGYVAIGVALAWCTVYASSLPSQVTTYVFAVLCALTVMIFFSAPLFDAPEQQKYSYSGLVLMLVGCWSAVPNVFFFSVIRNWDPWVIMFSPFSSAGCAFPQVQLVNAAGHAAMALLGVSPKFGGPIAMLFTMAVYAMPFAIAAATCHPSPSLAIVRLLRAPLSGIDAAKDFLIGKNAIRSSEDVRLSILLILVYGYGFPLIFSAVAYLVDLAGSKSQVWHSVEVTSQRVHSVGLQVWESGSERAMQSVELMAQKVSIFVQMPWRIIKDVGNATVCIKHGSICGTGLISGITEPIAGYAYSLILFGVYHAQPTGVPFPEKSNEDVTLSTNPEVTLTAVSGTSTGHVLRACRLGKTATIGNSEHDTLVAIQVGFQGACPFKPLTTTTLSHIMGPEGDTQGNVGVIMCIDNASGSVPRDLGQWRLSMFFTKWTQVKEGLVSYMTNTAPGSSGSMGLCATRSGNSGLRTVLYAAHAFSVGDETANYRAGFHVDDRIREDMRELTHRWIRTPEPPAPAHPIPAAGPVATDPLGLNRRHPSP